MVALYKRTAFCGLWRVIKRWYSTATPQGQRRAMRVRTWLQRFFMERIGGGSLDEYIRNYGEKRGMNFYNDLHDWMGGYPYESISPEECRPFLADWGSDWSGNSCRPRGVISPGYWGQVATNTRLFVRMRADV